MTCVRVVIPSYNRAGPLREAVESVLAQTFEEFEVVVVDDGSSDHTPEVLKQLAKRDRRVRWLRQENAGAAAARNAGIQAEGEYQFLAFLDSDDLWRPTHLEESLRAFNSSDEIGLVFSRYSTSDRAGKWSAAALESRRRRFDSVRNSADLEVGDDLYRLRASTARHALLAGAFCPSTSNTVLRISVTGPVEFCTDLAVLEDGWLWCTLAHRGVDLAFVDRELTELRYNGDNLTARFDLSDPRVLRNVEATCRFHRLTRKLCASRRDRQVVRSKIADSTYLLGQCLNEQRCFGKALAAYATCLAWGGGWRAIRGMAAAILPSRLRRALRAAEASRITRKSAV